MIPFVQLDWIEQLLKEGKHQLGMADYEVRSWQSARQRGYGWHRHMTLVMLAHSFLAFKRAQQREKKALADVA